MTEISFVFVDGSEAKFRTMVSKASVLESLWDLPKDVNFASLDVEDGTVAFVRLDQICHLSVKEIA